VAVTYSYGQTHDGHVLRMERFSLEADVRGGPQAAARARRLMQAELGGWLPSHVLSDAALLLTELVANGVRHGGAVAGEALHVRFERRPRALHVEVENPDHTPGRIGLRPPDLIGGGGLGLHIVERVASRWGVREKPRTAVWFELDCDEGDLL
jgi:anti-sigma regulatory factor (Ser/Thr protein kinase)